MSRIDNITYLNSIYASHTNDITIVYGSRYAGIRFVISDFISDKESFYFRARPCELKMQLSIIEKDFAAKTKLSGAVLGDFSQMVEYFSQNGVKKKIIVVDDFIHVTKNNLTFLNYLISIIREKCKPGTLMLILASSDPYFVENEFTKVFGKTAYEIKGLCKIEPFSINEINKKYSDISFEQRVSLYSVIGGNEYLWSLYKNGQTTRDYICENIIKYGSILNNYGNNILPEDLREKTVYNTILYILSEGNVKLNDIYEKTGYERAKIAVYLKKLINAGLVKKSDSFNIGNDKASKKGIYNICDPFTRFWYKFIFSNMSMCLVEAPDKFYRKHIEPYFNAYREQTYLEFCLAYLNDNKTFDGEIFDVFLDKNEAIDFAGRDENGKVIVGACRFSQPHMAYSRLEAMLKSIEKSKIKYDSIYLVSAIDFDQKLHLYSSVHDNVRLIDFRD